MPLEYNKSNKAFKKNVKTEIKSGKPIKQALAIAYSIKKRKKKKWLKIYKLSNLIFVFIQFVIIMSTFTTMSIFANLSII